MTVTSFFSVNVHANVMFVLSHRVFIFNNLFIYNILMNSRATRLWPSSLMAHWCMDHDKRTKSAIFWMAYHKICVHCEAVAAVDTLRSPQTQLALYRISYPVTFCVSIECGVFCVLRIEYRILDGMGALKISKRLSFFSVVPICRSSRLYARNK